MIITWGVDEVAPQLRLLVKIVQSEGSEMEGGEKMCVRGPFSPVRTTVLVSCVWTIDAAYSNDPLSPLALRWCDRFLLIIYVSLTQGVVFF